MNRIMFGTMLWLGAMAMASGEPVHDAARAGRLDEVKAAIKATPFLRSAQDGSGQTPAILAAGAGQVAVVEYLLSVGVKVDDATPTKRTMLHAACDGGKLEMAKYLVLKHRANVKAADERGLQPIHLAAQRNPIELLQFLIDQRADVNAQSKVGATPIMGAVNKKMRPQVELLLKNKADPNKAGEMGRTPLHYAVQQKDLPMVELLVKAGAKSGPKNSTGNTALDEATAAGLTDIVTLLERTSGVRKRPGAK